MKPSKEEFQVKELLAKNLKYLRTKVKDKTLEEVTSNLNKEIARNTLCGYENGTTQPSIFRLNDLSNYYGVSMNDLLNRDLEEQAYEFCDYSLEGYIPFESRIFRKFSRGQYWLYYYNTNFNKDKILNQGILNIEANKLKQCYEVSLEIEASENMYNGTFILTYSYIYIFLRGLENYERAFFAFYNYPEKPSKRYIGGLGIGTSISTGSPKQPCSQFILLSSKEIDTEIYKEDIQGLLDIPSTENIIRLDQQRDQDAYKLIRDIEGEKDAEIGGGIIV